MRADIVRTYKDVHSWVGIVSGLALFIAFYAGSITMFEGPLQRWASPPPVLSAPPSLERTPELVARVLAEHPEARKSHVVHLQTGPEDPARVSWSTGNRRNPGITHYASLDDEGELQVSTQGPSPVAQLVDVLHRQVGLPFAHEVSMPIMGAIALLYVVAIVSGVICLLPSLVKDLFALRFGRNLKRMWLDLHNALGLFSLPFHVAMALSSVVFAFHDQFYDAQGAVQRIGVGAVQVVERGETHRPPSVGEVLAPAELVAHIERQLPGFTLHSIRYETNAEEGPHGRIQGSDPRYGLRGPTYGVGEVDTVTGELIRSDYLPGVQDGWFATVSSFFALHFGNFGGAPVRWAYFVLGLAGAFLFYTGNLLWIESRRKKERKSGAVEQTRSTRVLGALTVGVPLGCVAGISLSIAAAKWLPQGLADAASWHSRVYYAVFVLAVAWSLARGAGRAGAELLWVAAAATGSIALTSLLSVAGIGWSHEGGDRFVDGVAVVGAIVLALMARAARRRAVVGPRDSVWSRASASASGEGLAEA